MTSNALVNNVIPIVKGLNLLSFLVAIGLLFAMGFLIPEKDGLLTKESLRLKPLVILSTSIWIVTLVGGFMLEIASLVGGGLIDAFGTQIIHDFIAQSSLARDYVFQLAIGVFIALAFNRVKRVRGVYFSLGLTLIALIAPIFESHASTSVNHELAIGALIFHVLFISLWVGGVIGLIAISPTARSFGIERFSAFALWAAIATGISGATSAWVRLNYLAGWSSLYGLLVALKIFLFIALVFIGRKHRSYIAKKMNGAPQMYRLLLNEAVVMVTAVAIGAWLSNVQPPTSQATLNLADDPVISITGIAMPAKPNFLRLFTTFVPDGAMIGVLLLITALYIRGVVALEKRGVRWPRGRSLSFALAVIAVFYATSGGLGVYAHFAFSYHMIAHMVLGMIAPIGFVLSAPITLALRTLPQGRTPEERGVRGTLIALIHSRYAVFMTNPIMALALFDGSLFALYMTPLFGDLMKSHSGHLFMTLHFLLTGYLFFYVIVGVDPNPRKIPYIVRIIDLFAAISIHAFFSIALMSSSSLLDGGYFASLQRPWSKNLLADQHNGGAIGWAMGEIPIIIALIATFIQWVRDDSREAKRIDRAADRAEASGKDGELERYNRYLAALNARDNKLDES